MLHVWFLINHHNHTRNCVSFFMLLVLTALIKICKIILYLGPPIFVDSSEINRGKDSQLCFNIALSCFQNLLVLQSKQSTHPLQGYRHFLGSHVGPSLPLRLTIRVILNGAAGLLLFKLIVGICTEPQS